ncbi:MAG: DUF2461 domain-containing protein [Saprospiraceae bacterium]|jgi:uncharacterized protein (TIGR02453 family)|nr:DUF2461 domain-containing protein [Saprospiraceae bacterium]
MPYFTQDFLNFFSELSENNDREWFNANKKRFKSNVEEPFKNFIAELIDRASAIDSNILMTPKDGMFRIYRDTRFGKDKTPYKTHLSAVVCEGGRKGKKVGGIYIEANHKGFKIYSGFYMPERKDLQKVREAIASDLSGFERLISDEGFKEKFGEVLGEKNKRIPKEFSEAAEKQTLMFNKSFYYFKEFSPETILQDDLEDICMDYFLAAKPLGDFFMEVIKEK